MKVFVNVFDGALTLTFCPSVFGSSFRAFNGQILFFFCFFGKYNLIIYLFDININTFAQPAYCFSGRAKRLCRLRCFFPPRYFRYFTTKKKAMPAACFIQIYIQSPCFSIVIEFFSCFYQIKCNGVGRQQ